jgi:hypothetical protein
MDVAGAFRLQAAACERLGSPFYAALLQAAANDVAAEGAVHDLVGGWNGDPVADAVALRVMGGVHRAVLRGDAPELAGSYPTAGGSPVWPASATAFLETVRRRLPVVAEALTRPPQTNEIGRAGALIGGLLETARIASLPLRVREIGASAGLNLLLDLFHFDLGAAEWGNPASPVNVATEWRGAAPALDTPLVIESRAGCDIAPLDVGTTDDAERVASYVWADQLDRYHRVVGAIDLARRHPVHVATAGAGDWLAAELTKPVTGVATIVMQSVMSQYLSAEARSRVRRLIRGAGRRATPDAPVAWLRFEPGARHFELRLALWPQGVDLMLADAHPHGAWAEWFVGSEPH